MAEGILPSPILLHSRMKVGPALMSLGLAYSLDAYLPSGSALLFYPVSSGATSNCGVHLGIVC